MKRQLFRSALFISISLTCITPTQAQFSDYIPLTSGKIESPSALAVGDLDGDGLVDVLSASFSDHRIAWYRNIDNHRFSQQQTLSDEVREASDVEVGDLDGDGDLDIAASSCRDSTLVLFFNTGEGVFATPQILNLYVNDINGLELADLDQDEDLDIIWFATDTDTLGWLANDGSGGFPEAHSFGSQVYNPFSLQVADLDENGFPDILFSKPEANGVTWLANMGDGEFASPVELEGGISEPYAIKAADLNGDQKPEVLAISGDGSRLFIFNNLGNGQFAAPQPFTSTFISSGSPIQTADLDLDGDLDVLCGNTSHDLIWLVNDGQGAFPEVITIPSTATPSLIEIADIDQNDREDIVIFAYPGFIEWLPNEEENPFHQARGITTLSEEPKKVTHADLNNDGFVDLLVESKYKMTWLPNDSAGVFGPQLRFYNNIISNAGMLQAANLNGDEHLDIINGVRDNGPGASSDQIRWKANNGSGDFTGFDHSLLGFSSNFYLSDFSVADLNGNGVDDVVYVAISSEEGGPILEWLESNGNGQFSNPVNIDTETGYGATVECADLDGDGLIDLLVNGNPVVSSSPSIFWYRNLGSGQFAARVNISPSGISYYEGVLPTDLDTDGDLDILAYGGNQGMLWFQNLGAGTFANAQFINSITNILNPLPVDLDRDGDKDLIYVETNNNNVMWLENLGPALFLPPEMLATAAQDLTGFHAADLDGDSYPEIITWSRDYHTTGYYQNLIGRADISGYCFHDENQNGQFDSGERPLPGMTVQLQPEGLYAFSDSRGQYKFYVPPGDYSLNTYPRNCWELSLDTTYMVNLADSPVMGLDFAFTAGDSQTGVTTTLVTTPLRCETVVQAWIQVENPNCVTVPGLVQVTLDGLLTYVDAQPPALTVSPDIVTWDLDSLPPAERRHISLRLQVAGSEFTGTVAQIGVQANPQFDALHSLHSKEYILSDTIRCSYDPNDKQVNQKAVPIDYLPDEQELRYTIRFQNTGNDTAFLVRLLDTLSTNLDWPTLRPLASSHPYYMEFNSTTGLITFEFDNILLPDSTTNEPASHGFVQFAIQLQPDLPPGTVIRNRAGIYFDANPVVLTNTVETQVQLEVSAVNSPPKERTFHVFPNPSEGRLWIRFDHPPASNGTLNVRDVTGRLVLSRQVQAGITEQNLDLFDFPSGMYLVQWFQPGKAEAFVKIVLQK